MPEVMFDVRWPDGATHRLYSPSLIVEEYFAAGASYPLPEFVRLAREALGIASDRVEARYGIPCARAASTLESIETTAAGFGDDGEVTLAAFRR